MATDDNPVDSALRGVEELYTGNLREHGTSSKSVGWRDEAQQQLRFDKLAHVFGIAPTDGAVTVNDFGCGYGAMFDYLAARQTPQLAAYTGSDISEAMLTAARDRIDDPRASFVLDARITNEADFTFVSGTFNVRMNASDDDWSAYIFDTLRHLATVSRRGLAFNLLTSYVDWRKDDLFYADPTVFFDFCRRELGKRVALLHDYPLYEWTIAVGFDGR